MKPKKFNKYLLTVTIGIISFYSNSIASSIPLQKNFFILNEATIDSTHAAINTKQINCEHLVNLYLNRIRHYNLDISYGAPLNAITYINLNALDEARKLDNFYIQTNRFIGPLHCVTVLLKDNIDTYDSPSSSGSLALLGSQPVEDAFLVKKLRKAGAIILGKTSMDELISGGYGISSKSGKTGNSYDANRNSGGSSAGSAVAISANFALIAIGTDNSGSLRIPAAYNGLYTIRSTTGVVSQTGIFPRANLNAIAGPITRTTKDLAIVMNVIAKSDKRDIKTHNIPRPDSYTKFLNPYGLQGKRIGILRTVGGQNQFRNVNKQVMKVYNQTLQKMQHAGAIIIDNIQLPQFVLDQTDNMAGEIEDINAYLASFPSTRNNFQDICNSEKTSIFGSTKECLERAKTTAKKFSEPYQQVLKKFHNNRTYVEKTMDKYNLDALLTPVDAHGIAEYDISGNGINCLVASNTGMPSIVIVAGYITIPKMLPVGLELIGRSYTETALIEIAYSIEVNHSQRIPPNLREPLAQFSLANLSIPQLNNLFILIGYDAYESILNNGTPGDLTPKRFRQIVKKQLKLLNNKRE